MLSLLLLFTSAFTASAAPWIEANDNPATFFDTWNAKLSELKTSSQSKSKVWSGYYYPNFSGGIAFRWEGVENFKEPSPETNPHTYEKLTKKEVLKMSEEELNKLSAAEKYDIFKRKFKFPTLKGEIERSGPKNPNWIGLCNGWAAATVRNDGEPRTFEHTLKNGKKMTFYSSDIKALLAYYEARFVSPNVLPSYMGKRCNSRDSSLPECSGMNPGAFHLALANRIGIQQKAFVMDLDRTYQVWNHPVYAYDSKLEEISEREYKASTTVWYLQESAPYYKALSTPQTLGITYDYTIELMTKVI